MRSQNLKFVAVALVIIHLLISFIHGLAHQGAAITLTSFQNVYVLVVITIGPILSTAFLFSRWQRFAALMLALTMLGSLVFGGWYHFFSATADNVDRVYGAWHSTFLWSAVAIAILEAVGMIAGVRIYRARSQTSS